MKFCLKLNASQCTTMCVLYVENKFEDLTSIYLNAFEICSTYVSVDQKNLENSNHLFNSWICLVALRNCSDNLNKICILFVHNNVSFVILNV